MATKKTEKLDEDFKPSFNAPGNIPGPVGKDAVGRNRRADKDDGQTAMPTLPKSQMIADMVTKAASMDSLSLAPGYAEFMKIAASGGGTAEGNRGTIKAGKSGGLKEDMDLVFDGADLSEEFKEKATAIFEAAVISRVTSEVVRLQEESEQAIEDGIAEGVSAIEENVTKYLDHVAAEWIQENRLQVESGIRADILENFMGGLKDLFVEHYIEIPEDKVDVVEELTGKIEELTAKLNESENEIIEARSVIQKTEAEAIVREVSEGLTVSQADQLKSLSEEIEFTSPEEFEVKLKAIAEGYVLKKSITPATEQLNEELELDESASKTVITDPMIAQISASIRKSAKN